MVTWSGMRRLFLAFGVLTALLAFAVGTASVDRMAEDERDEVGQEQTLSELRSSEQRLLVSAVLAEGQRAFFEVCSSDAFDPGEWAARAFTIHFLEAGAPPEQAARVAFEDVDPDAFQRGEAGGCVVFKRWDEVLVAGEFAIGLEVQDEGEDPRVRGRILAYREIDGLGRAVVAGSLLAALMILLAFLFPARPFGEFELLSPRSERKPRWPPWARVLVGVLGLLLVMFAVGFVHGGSAMAVVRALIIAATQVGLALWLVERLAAGDEPARVDIGLALTPSRPRWILLAMPVLGIALWLVGSRLGRLVPSTGIAPIEAFVSYPSGSLAVALIAVFVPLAEELFFRGFVYTALDRARGANIATAVSLVVFALVHLPQQWGAWGAFVSVAFTGTVLTLLRRWTRSTLPGVLAHLSHNAVITVLALA